MQYAKWFFDSVISDISESVSIDFADLFSFTPDFSPSWCYVKNGMVYIYITGVSTSRLLTNNFSERGVKIANCTGFSFSGTIRIWATGEKGNIYVLDFAESGIKEYHLVGQSYPSDETFIWRIIFPVFPVSFLSTTVRNKYGV